LEHLGVGAVVGSFPRRKRGKPRLQRGEIGWDQEKKTDLPSLQGPKKEPSERRC